ncbi:MAG: ATP-binding cassette domain-containing protein [Fusobacteriaceae bacterium]|jgi:ABC-type Mn2+/Zn2+ transport system ATPase subunit|nr:ATP-binding cassette domain-containing protein [Fusobacteriaceae bacterium]
MREVILSVKDLNLTVKGKNLLENINFSIDKGEYLAISGICGSGKSILIKSLLGIVTAGLTGEIHYHNIGKDEVTYIPQNILDIKDDFIGSTKEIVAIGLLSKLKGRCMTEESWVKVDEILELLNLSEVKDKKINKLSHWQQFKVKIARHLIIDPKLIFIDSPSSTSNTKLKNELYKVLKDICNNRNTTIIHITQEVKGISPFADKLLFLNKNDNSFYFGDIKNYIPTK